MNTDESIQNEPRQLVVHPYLFALFPLLITYCVLYAAPIPTDQLLPPALGILVVVAIFHSLTFLLLKNIRLAGLYTTFLVCLFFSPTIIIIVITKCLAPELQLTAIQIGEPSLVVFWLALLYVGFRFLHIRSHLIKATKLLNEISLCLMILESSVIAAQYFETYFVKYPVIANAYHLRLTPIKCSSQAVPNVYYIILDKMAASPTLSKVFGYDNAPFLEFLKRKGFYIALNSHSNYQNTMLSLGSTLNQNYLNIVAQQYSPDTINLAIFCPLIRNNTIVDWMRSVGYKFINISSGFGPTDWMPDADENISVGGVSKFASDFTRSTMLGTCSPLIKFLDDLYRAQKRLEFQQLVEVSKRPGPQFVFAHILLPHEPFVFTASGAPGSQSFSLTGDSHWDPPTKQAYIEQLKFAETQIESVIEHIIANSKTPPIIVLQSDHGTSSSGTMGNPEPSKELLDERFRILNAYLVPKEVRPFLYDTITPVNSFRTILKAYFNLPLARLDDRSYYTPLPYSFKFTDETAALARQ